MEMANQKKHDHFIKYPIYDTIKILMIKCHSKSQSQGPHYPEFDKKVSNNPNPWIFNNSSSTMSRSISRKGPKQMESLVIV